ncbi:MULTISPECIES: carboxypeptidase [Bacillus]|uniref:Metal-dependent carboxypeptidase n=1 Tax=Bacillus anthracis TaxID=1392 RepID=A0A2B0Y631_BACAN|nr:MULTISPECIES: carboxypeptidase [Bacillus]MCU0097065.1 carboxypeptidase [Bacillus sp. OR9]MBJ8057788.1 carboxypeptidase [Bacillus cereus]MCU4755868.1 carboxypeptidase [Bacillus cereus]MCU5104948.1 carboxypeptidase [Bacillus cereus]MCU5340335.1 carboxypeptidase [Bacillus cereus]
MTVATYEVEKQFLTYVKKIQNYGEALSLMFWDLRTGAPKKGVDQRSEVIGMLSSEVFAMSTSDEMGNYLTELENLIREDKLSETTKKMVEECRKEYDRNKKIPQAEYEAYVKLEAKAESVWEEAREKSDFEMFRPYLEKIVEFKKKFITYWGYETYKYNTLLDMYEPGITVEVLDHVFGQLRERIVPLVKEISESQKRLKTSALSEHFSKEKQKNFTLELLKQLNYDFEAGRLDETVHPFEITLNRGDVRITTRYDEKDFRMAVFGTIHECGHAVYEQNIAEKFEGTPLCSGTSMGIHESQSLFFENFIGRNKSFWKKNYDVLKEYSDGQFNDISVDEFYDAINESKPSFIRIEADELTYPLHVMVRYELEKELFDGTLQVKDLPAAWNDKMEAYLGIRPANDAQGVLQDVHWAGGSFGYFPSYALGYMYAAQFKERMLKDIPNFDALLEEGNVTPIREWLTENIHQYGKTKKPLEILEDVTGEGLNANYLADYLEAKYKEIYEL